MDVLTEEERQFLEKLEQNKKKHSEAQIKYRNKNIDKINEYNTKYFKDKQRKAQEIKAKIINQEPTKIDIKHITEKPIINKQRRGGKKQEEALNVIPKFITRGEVLELSTIATYIKQANIIHKIFKQKNLSQEVKRELTKLLNDNKNLDEKLILDEMDYINDNIDETIKKIREHYENDNTFRTYLNILTVIASHLKTIDNSIYQKLTKIGKFINENIQSKRGNNELDDKDEGKIIDLNREVIISNIEKLKDIEDRLIYGLYTIQPSRRLEYRNMKLTRETDIKKLNDINYIIISSLEPYKFVFNDYKTYKIYRKQIIKIDEDLKKIINKYISINELKEGDYLFSLNRNKKEIYDEGGFSKKISNIFNKVYGKPISIRFLRMSWSIYINNNKQLNFNEKEALIKNMGHSFVESQKYFKKIDINKKND